MGTKWNRLLRKMLLVLCYYSFGRIVFTIANLAYFPEINLLDFLQLSLRAMRFDLAALCMVNITYIGLVFLPLGSPNATSRKKTEELLFLCTNIIAFLFDWSDWAYFAYNQKRATADVLHLLGRGSDFWYQAPTLITQYWYLFGAAILLSVMFVRINRKIIAQTPVTNEANVSASKPIRWLNLLLAISASIIGIRGGLQMVPIGIRNAVQATPNNNWVPIVLNTPFSIGSTLNNRQLENLTFYDAHTAETILPSTKQYGKKKFQHKNIVVLILESFSKEFTGMGGMQSYTPFLDSLAKHSLVCTNAFANGYRSAEGIPAILAGIPSITEEPFTTSAYGANRITSIANLLKPLGYQSAFYHGGTNGTMSFDLFAKNAGFDRYIGRSEYNNDQDFDGIWGIWDEPFLQYCVQDINKHLPQPFVASIFTLSAHHPYNVPTRYQQMLPKGNLPIHQPIAYTDWALRQFFKQAQKTNWYYNTLFILVADHCSPLSNDDYYHYHQGRFAIPILYFAPSDSTLKGQNNALTQQIDILPSVMDYLGLQHRFYALGNSIFSTTKHRYTIQQWSGNLLFTLDDFFLQCAYTKPIGLFNTTADKLCKHNLISENDSLLRHSEAYLRAFRQQYHNTLRQNKMWVK